MDIRPVPDEAASLSDARGVPSRVWYRWFRSIFSTVKSVSDGPWTVSVDNGGTITNYTVTVDLGAKTVTATEV